MATYLDLVVKYLEYTEKILYSETSEGQRELALRHVNDARRYVYNHGDLSFKTVTEPNFEYVYQTDPDAPSKGTPLPADFLGFHQTGKVFVKGRERRGPLVYKPYHRMMELIEGVGYQRFGEPQFYSVGGPADPASEANQREIVIWPSKASGSIFLKLIYQSTGPEDIEDIDAMDIEIPRIPRTWHIPVILEMAKVFGKADKGADPSIFSSALATAIAQMDIQEPHGREAPPRRAIFPSWRRSRRW